MECQGGGCLVVRRCVETIEEAYIYAFPLVLMDATRTSATNTEEAAPGKAPVNQFMHGVALANAQFKKRGDA